MFNIYGTNKHKKFKDNVRNVIKKLIGLIKKNIR